MPHENRSGMLNKFHGYLKRFKRKQLNLTYMVSSYGFRGAVKFFTDILHNKTIETGNALQKPSDFSELSVRDTDDFVLIRFEAFQASNSKLVLPAYSEPEVSIVILLHNRAAISFQCLESIVLGAGKVSFEVILVDNASSDNTEAMLRNIENAKIIRNSTNLGFGGGCNQAVAIASGKFLLFLNNDAQLMPNSLQIMVDTIKKGKKIGAVGGRLMFKDGRLQEAGSIIWKDGSCQGYGRNKNPFQPEFSYVRSVDFCSGALLLTPRELFASLNGFDAIYQPAYYEDVDYCMRLWKEGYRIIYQPFAMAIHYEYGSSGGAKAIELQELNRRKFVKKWKQSLELFHNAPGQSNILASREHRINTKRILFVDDQIPDHRLGYGLPRTYKIIETLAQMGYRITFLPLQFSCYAPDITSSLQNDGIEVLYSPSEQKIDFISFIKNRPNYYDMAIISRPHNMKEIIAPLREYSGKTKVIYDAEALFCLREIAFNELGGLKIHEDEKEELIKSEVGLADQADVIVAVSTREKEHFTKYSSKNVHVLSYALEANPTAASFAERKGILFVGSILSYPSPNEDAVRYFVKQIFPLIFQKLQCHLYIVGTNRVQSIWNLNAEYVHIVGRVDDLFPYYNNSRLFVVPTRFAAGVPLKLMEAAACGLPAVVTPLIASQIGWEVDKDILVGQTPVDFAKKTVNLYNNEQMFYALRENALQRIRKEYGHESFHEAVEKIITAADDIVGQPKGILN